MLHVGLLSLYSVNKRGGEGEASRPKLSPNDYELRAHKGSTASA